MTMNEIEFRDASKAMEALMKAVMAAIKQCRAEHPSLELHQMMATLAHIVGVFAAVEMPDDYDECLVLVMANMEQAFSDVRRMSDVRGQA